jgi:hypothetical protein
MGGWDESRPDDKGDGDPQQVRQRALVDQQPGDDREVHRHRQVLDDQQRQHDRRLPVAQPLELLEQPGDDPRRRDVRDTAQERCAERTPVEQQPGGEPGDEVGGGVHDAGDPVAAQPVEQLVGRVLQPEHEEEQHHADLGASVDEVFAGFDRVDAALPDEQAGEEVQRDRRQAHSSGEPADHAKGEQDHPELEQHLAGVVAGGGENHVIR